MEFHHNHHESSAYGSLDRGNCHLEKGKIPSRVGHATNTNLHPNEFVHDVKDQNELVYSPNRRPNDHRALMDDKQVHGGFHAGASRLDRVDLSLVCKLAHVEGRLDHVGCVEEVNPMDHALLEFYCQLDCVFH